MKKLRKILAVLTSGIMMSMCAPSVSAANYDFDPSKVVFSSVGAPPNLYYDHSELWIDENLILFGAYYNKAQVVVRIPNGSEPPYLDENDHMALKKLSKAQLAEMKQKQCSGSWGSFYDDLNVEVTDNMYCIWFRSPDAAESYCKRLLDEKIADYAEQIMNCSYGQCGVEEKYVTENMNKLGIDNTNFDEYKFVFYAEVKNEESAAAFDVNSIKGLKECASVMTKNGNTIYFQFNEDANKETVLNVLKAIDSNNELQLGVANMGGIAELDEDVIDNIPHNYPQGDVNRNDEVDLQDAIKVAKQLVTKSELDEVQMYIADFDENDNVDLHDVIGIAKSLL